jgi:hypothetical protein
MPHVAASNRRICQGCGRPLNAYNPGDRCSGCGGEGAPADVEQYQHGTGVPADRAGNALRAWRLTTGESQVDVARD